MRHFQNMESVNELVQKPVNKPIECIGRNVAVTSK